MADNRQTRRYPHNLQGVLQLAVEAGSAAEGPAPSEPMSEERKAWLREALVDACKGQMDEVEQMKRCLEILREEETSESERDEDEDDRESVFETLSELCENLDNARDLMTLGGLELCVSRYLSHVQSGLRWRAAELIASCAQNMPQVQVYLLDLGTLPKLLHLTDTDPNPTVKVKALYAVSCLVRELEKGLKAFLSHDGFSVLMRGMQISVLRLPHLPFHEHVLGALCCLVEDSPQGLADCTNPALGLEELLRQRATELKGKEESQEELDFCEHLRSMCFHGRPSDDSGMDR
ncbi:hsp70-binding protein 1 [Cynoglossus semilaevis]|uniref:hsp70-binding protein 1 n=1 Tax=Cynoglossus semilaevis TaxID=244447 RepID=UPI0004969ECA|nr:hsp70-binding protein 1 [Cynoglossus semilaevis]